MRALRALAFAVTCAFVQSPAGAEQTSNDATRIDYSIEAGIQSVGKRNLFWTLPDTFAPAAAFDVNREWAEYYVKPGVAVTHGLGAGMELYGALSMVGSGTSGYDAFDTGNTGRATVEDAFAGWRFGIPGSSARVDLSGGAQRYNIGTGMLVSNGVSPSWSTRNQSGGAGSSIWSFRIEGRPATISKRTSCNRSSAAVPVPVAFRAS